jgi:hypothetical protein
MTMTVFATSVRHAMESLSVSPATTSTSAPSTISRKLIVRVRAHSLTTITMAFVTLKMHATIHSQERHVMMTMRAQSMTSFKAIARAQEHSLMRTMMVFVTLLR